MIVRIRLKKISRTSKGRYNFRIVVISKKDARDSRPIEGIGYYNPSRNPISLTFNKERYDYWIGKGAQPTETVASLFKKFSKNQIKK